TAITMAILSDAIPQAISLTLGHVTRGAPEPREILTGRRGTASRTRSGLWGEGVGPPVLSDGVDLIRVICIMCAQCCLTFRGLACGTAVLSGGRARRSDLARQGLGVGEYRARGQSALAAGRAASATAAFRGRAEIGRASCRERVESAEVAGASTGRGATSG